MMEGSRRIVLEETEMNHISDKTLIKKAKKNKSVSLQLLDSKALNITYLINMR